MANVPHDKKETFLCARSPKRDRLICENRSTIIIIFLNQLVCLYEMVCIRPRSDNEAQPTSEMGYYCKCSTLYNVYLNGKQPLCYVFGSPRCKQRSNRSSLIAEKQENGSGEFFFFFFMQVFISPNSKRKSDCNNKGNKNTGSDKGKKDKRRTRQMTRTRTQTTATLTITMELQDNEIRRQGKKFHFPHLIPFIKKAEARGSTQHS